MQPGPHSGVAAFAGAVAAPTAPTIVNVAAAACTFLPVDGTRVVDELMRDSFESLMGSGGGQQARARRVAGRVRARRRPCRSCHSRPRPVGSWELVPTVVVIDVVVTGTRVSRGPRATAGGAVPRREPGLRIHRSDAHTGGTSPPDPGRTSSPRRPRAARR